jgi:hypothetical protein
MPVIQMEETKSFLSNLKSSEELALELVTGNNAEGKPHYALLLLPVNKVKELKIALSMKDIVLEDYGQVMARGDGHEPPADLVEDILGLLTAK